MLVKDIIFEKEDNTAELGQRIINLLKKTPSVDSPLLQFKKDPNKIHNSARSSFRMWCKRMGLKYVHSNVMMRGGPATTRIAFYAFVGMMQKECGISVNGILDVKTMKGFISSSSKFSDSYISNRVENAIASSSFKVPRGCIDVVKAIENPGKNWGSTYATYHDITGRLDFGVGPGQVEPKTYGDIGGSFDFGNLEHMTSIDMLTNMMLETIQHKMKFADIIAKKNKRDEATLEDFAKAWNPVNFGKAKKIYGEGQPMRSVIKASPTPPKRPAELDEPTQKQKPKLSVDKKSIDSAVKTALEPEAPTKSPSYYDKLKKGFGNMLRNYLDSEG